MAATVSKLTGCPNHNSRTCSARGAKRGEPNGPSKGSSMTVAARPRALPDYFRHGVRAGDHPIREMAKRLIGGTKLRRYQSDRRTDRQSRGCLTAWLARPSRFPRRRALWKPPPHRTAIADRFRRLAGAHRSERIESDALRRGDIAREPTPGSARWPMANTSRHARPLLQRKPAT